MLAQHHEGERIHRLNFPDAHPSIVDPFFLHPQPKGLLCWGKSDSNVLFWQVIGAPDQWHTVIYNGRDGEYESFRMSTTSVLAGLLSGQLISSLLHDAIGAQPPSFTPLSP